MGVAENIAGGGHKKDSNHNPHASGQQCVHARRGLDALHIQRGEYSRKKDGPYCVGHIGRKYVSDLAAPDNADHWIEHVVHHHAPTRDESEYRVNLLAYVGECRSGARVDPRHTSVAEGGKQHTHHRDQDGCYHVTMPAVAEHAVDRHGSDGLNDDDAVEDQVPQSEGTFQASGGDSGPGVHDASN